MSETRKKLSELSNGKAGNASQRVVERRKNASWLKLSRQIAVRVLGALRSRELSQRELAGQLGVTPQYVNKMLKGRENFTIETITKLQQILNIRLIEVPRVLHMNAEPPLPGYVNVKPAAIIKKTMKFSGEAKYDPTMFNVLEEHKA